MLNSRVYFTALAAKDVDGVYDKVTGDMFDPAAIKRLNEIIVATSADVVISSSWRLVYPLDEIKAYLKHKGFVGNILGITPYAGARRGEEIQQWLDESILRFDRVAILDDDSDMAPLQKYHVHTTYEYGLQNEHVQATIKLLSAL